MGSWEPWRPQFDYFSFENYCIFDQNHEPQVVKGTMLPDKSFAPKILENINEGNAQKHKICIGDKRLIGINVEDNSFVAKCGSELSMIAIKTIHGLVCVVQGQGFEPRSYNKNVMHIGNLLNGNAS